MQSDHQDFQRAGSGEIRGAFAEEPDELVMNDFDDLLPGGDALEDLLADTLLLHAFDEFARHLEMHVGGEQRGAHFLECLRHVVFGEFANAAQIAEGAAQFFGEGFEHETRTVWRNGGRGKPSAYAPDAVGRAREFSSS